MSWQLVHLADVKPVPWRNGGGETRELLAWPNAANWVWRMSVAAVASDGPFSRFEGIERWFTVLSGAGVRLSGAFDPQPPRRSSHHNLTPASAPFCFDGAAPVHCQLLDGATQDFNLMLRRDQASAQMLRIAGLHAHVSDTPEVIAIYTIDTEARLHFDSTTLLIPAHSLAWRIRPAGASVQVNAAHALLMAVQVCV